MKESFIATGAILVIFFGALALNHQILKVEHAIESWGQ